MGNNQNNQNKDLAFMSHKKCDCLALIHRGTYTNYDSPDRVSNWDDFGYLIYEDEVGMKHQLYGHKHVDMLNSYTHACYEEPRKGWEQIEFVKDNSVIPKINGYLTSLHETWPLPWNYFFQGKETKKKR